MVKGNSALLAAMALAMIFSSLPAQARGGHGGGRGAAGYSGAGGYGAGAGSGRLAAARASGQFSGQFSGQVGNGQLRQRFSGMQGTAGSGWGGQGRLGVKTQPA